MSRTRRGGKGPGYDFWSRRSGVLGSGPEGKRRTTATERTRNKEIEMEAMEAGDSDKGRFAGE